MEDKPVDLKFRDALHQEFLKRCALHPRYSLRAFAEEMEIHSSTLSKILSGKRSLTPRMIVRLATQIGMTEDEVREVVESELRNRDTQSEVQPSQTERFNRSPQRFTTDAFNILSDWTYATLMHLPRLKSYRPGLDWAAEQTGLNTSQVREKLKQLERMNLITRLDDGSWEPTGSVKDPMPRDPYSGNAEKLMAKKLNQLKSEDHEARTLILPIDSRKRLKLMRRIERFLGKFQEEAESPKMKYDSIHALTVSLRKINK